VLGTRSTAEVALVTHSSPIFCTLPGTGSVLQFLGSMAASMSTMYDSSIPTRNNAEANELMRYHGWGRS
jgi:hypothetical protein